MVIDNPEVLFYLCCATILVGGCVYIWSATQVGRALGVLIAGVALLALAAGHLGAWPDKIEASRAQLAGAAIVAVGGILFINSRLRSGRAVGVATAVGGLLIAILLH